MQKVCKIAENMQKIWVRRALRQTRRIKGASDNTGMSDKGCVHELEDVEVGLRETKYIHEMGLKLLY